MESEREMGLLRQFVKRLAKVEQVLDARPAAGQFDVVQAIPLDHAGGRPLGLHPSGPEGLTAGVFVYDPSKGEPQLAAGTLSTWGLFIVPEPASFVPGIDSAS